jgi:NAD(P)-dependent dehydrogenase (short-subunit alcohol dehydrogenase family)
MTFEGQVTIVTGAASGIGEAVARRFAAAGATVILADIQGEAALRVAADLQAAGGRAEGVSLDVADAASIESVVAQVHADHGALDHAICCAGVASRHTIAQMGAEQWRRVIDVNLTGVFLTLKAAAGVLRSGGSITAISSIAAEHIAYLSGVHYAASKSGLTGLVRQAAFELGRHGIRVNAIAPGPMSNRMGGGRIDDDRLKRSARNLPLQRVVEPADIAEACAFLASPAASAITGVYLPVDCGFLTARGAAYRDYFDLHGEPF